MRQIQVSHIRGYEDVKDSYILYEDGTCININTNRFLKITLDNRGYPVYDLTKRKNNRQHKRCRIHRLLAQAFISNPNNFLLKFTAAVAISEKKSGAVVVPLSLLVVASEEDSAPVSFTILAPILSI